MRVISTLASVIVLCLGLALSLGSKLDMHSFIESNNLSAPASPEPSWYAGTMVLLALAQLLRYFHTREKASLLFGTVACLGIWLLKDGVPILVAPTLNLSITSEVQQILFSSGMVGVAWWLAEQDRRQVRTARQAQDKKIQQLQLALEKIQSAESALEAKLFQRTHELHQALEQIEAVSALDALTGVANRRRFEEVLKMEWGRAARSRKALSIALIDVDWLSNFNSHYGHDKGDEQLCKLVRVLQSGVMRSSDLIARYRGGCFALLAPDTDASGILSIANYLRQEVLELNLPHEDSPFGRISISVGVATSVKPEARKAEVLLLRAHAALTQAKSRGRNQVIEG